MLILFVFVQKNIVTSADMKLRVSTIAGHDIKASVRYIVDLLRYNLKYQYNLHTVTKYSTHLAENII